jgi:DNA-directed RNA polymerase specialized sigma24 family protein
MCNSTVSQNSHARKVLDMTAEMYAELRRETAKIVHYYGWAVDPDDLLHESILQACRLFEKIDSPYSLAGFLMKGLRFRYYKELKHYRRVKPFCQFSDYAVEHLVKYELDDRDSSVESLTQMRDAIVANADTRSESVAARIKPLLDLFAESVMKDAGIGITEYDQAPQSKQGRTRNSRGLNTRIPRKRILEHAAQSLGRTVWQTKHDLKYLRKVTTQVTDH